MKNFFIKIILFLTSKNFWKYVLSFGVCIALFVLLMFVLAKDVINSILGTVIGFACSGILLYFAKICFSSLEDYAKVSKDNKRLKSIYPNQDYVKTVHLNGTNMEVLYSDLKVDLNGQFDVSDNPQKRYELPSFADGNFAELLDAHSRSVKINGDTVRLDDIVNEDGKQVFHLSRSTFYNHLATNRAIDYRLGGGVTIRSMFEYGPNIKPLNESQLSNHIGINALVFLNDGTLLVPRRKNNSTISKNMITSSIAVKLNPLPNGELITKEYLFSDNVKNSLTARLKIPREIAEKLDAKITFIGIGQNIYEGGKPQMYFAVKINNLNKQEYVNYKSQVKKQEGKIDIDKCIYLADYSSMKFVHDKIRFNYTKEKSGKVHHKTLGFEKSFICNLWHYENLIKQDK